MKFAISIAILTYLFNQAAATNQFSSLMTSQKNWLWLAFGIFSCLLAHLIGFWRWQLLVRTINLPFSFVDSMRIGFIGMFFNLIAFGVIGGDALRAFYVAREFKNRKSEAIASVIADRMIGILTMFIIASFAFLILDTNSMESIHPKKLAGVQWICYFVMTMTGVGIAALAAMFFTPRLHKRAWFRKLLAIPTLGPILQKILAVISVYRNRPMAVLVGFLLSFLVNLCFAVSIYFVAAGLVNDFPNLPNHFVIEPIAMVSNAVPLPGGLGGMEFVLDFLYQAFGCDHGIIVAFAFRFCLLLVSAIGAFVWFLNRRQVDGLMPVQQS